MDTAVAIESATDEQHVPSMPFPILLTERSAQMVQAAMADEQMDGYLLRVGVTGGGCSGLQYALDFAEQASDTDFVGESQGVTICIDPYSAAHLHGTTITYVDDIKGTGFKFENPNVTRACGCGSSFQT